MKKMFMMLMLAMTLLTITNCSKVPAGNVGIKFYLLGTNKGVDSEVLKPGRYYIGINQELYLFPTFTQNYVWTKDKQEGSESDESFTFQDIQGLSLNADIGITYKLNQEKIPEIFAKYKKGVTEITDIYLRNMVRDALVKRTSTMYVEKIYGEERTSLMESVQMDVASECKSIGIDVEKIYWIGEIRIPAEVTNAINLKIKATQIAQQRENELREAEAAAKIKIAQAEAEATSNRLKTLTITKELIEYEKIKKWDGKLPQISGGNTIPMIDFK